MSISYQEAIAYSFNYASAKPDIGNTEREHILGLCAALEAVGKERAVLADSNTQLMQQNEAQIKMNAKLMHERDALAAHVEKCRQVSKSIQGYRLPDSRRSLNMALNAIDEMPATSLARRDAQQQAKGLTMVFDDPVWGHLSGDAKDLVSGQIDQLERQAAGDENDGY